MKEISERTKSNPKDIYPSIPAPSNRNYSISSEPLTLTLGDPAVSLAISQLSPGQQQYINELIERVSQDYPNIGSIRKDLGSKTPVKSFEASDPDTPFDTTILKKLYLTGLFRSM